jgi:hypothetical protein
LPVNLDTHIVPQPPAKLHRIGDFLIQTVKPAPGSISTQIFAAFLQNLE